MKTLFSFTLLIVTIVCSIALVNASEALSLKQVIVTVIDKHPDLNVNRIDHRIAETERQRVQGLLDPVISAKMVASEEKVPVSSDFQASETRTGQLNASISKPFSNGGTVSANITYNRINQAFRSPFAAQLARFNPAFRNQINLSYRQSLLKGANRPDYHQSLFAAEAGVESADMQARVIRHQLSLQATNIFYQLKADDLNIHIAEQAVMRAKKLLKYQRSREQFGLIEKADRLQAGAFLAARNTDLQRAKAQRFTDQSRLNRLMRHQSDQSITVQTSSNMPMNTITTTEDAVDTAKQHRPELQLLNSQLKAADAQLLIALDGDQIQLDVIIEAGSRALATSFGKGVTRVLEINDQRYYVALSFELSDVLGRHAINASVRKAELARQRISSQRLQSMERIKDDIAAARSAITSGLPSLAIAIKQVEAEQKKFTAEMKRYRQGRSDTATLVQFEGELRNASLNAELQRISLQLAQQQLLWAQGILLTRLGISEPARMDNKP